MDSDNLLELKGEAGQSKMKAMIGMMVALPFNFGLSAQCAPPKCTNGKIRWAIRAPHLKVHYLLFDVPRVTTRVGRNKGSLAVEVARCRRCALKLEVYLCLGRWFCL